MPLADPLERGALHQSVTPFGLARMLILSSRRIEIVGGEDRFSQRGLLMRE